LLQISIEFQVVKKMAMRDRRGEREEGRGKYRNYKQKVKECLVPEAPKPNSTSRAPTVGNS
jgi:hypothetical protein